jgi:hypothetical protein
METDAPAPFVQCILRHADGWERIIKDDCVERIDDTRVRFHVSAEAFHAGILYLQIEGCRTADLTAAAGEDWVKVYLEHHAEEPVVIPKEDAEPPAAVMSPAEIESAVETMTLEDVEESTSTPLLYLTLHQSLLLPHEYASDPERWNEDEDGRFATAMGASLDALTEVARSCPGFSLCLSGELIHALNACAFSGLGGGRFTTWNHPLARLLNDLAPTRLSLSRTGWSQAILYSLPSSSVHRQLTLQTSIQAEAFGMEAPDLVYPPTLGFSLSLIPELLELGGKAVFYDTIHHYRACLDYEGDDGLPAPSGADQENYRRYDWVNVPGKHGEEWISPGLLRPSILSYTDTAGHRFEMTGLPVDSSLSRLLKEEDDIFESALTVVLDRLEQDGGTESDDPSYLVLSGNDNDPVCRWERLQAFVQQDSRIAWITPDEYLRRFAVDPSNLIHLETGVAMGQEQGLPAYRRANSETVTEAEVMDDLHRSASLLSPQSVVERDVPEHNALLVMTAEVLHGGWAQNAWQRLAEHQEKGLKAETPQLLMPWLIMEEDVWIQTLVLADAGVESVTLLHHEVGGGFQTLTMERVEAFEDGDCASLYAVRCPEGVENLRYCVEVKDCKGRTVHGPLCRMSVSMEP